jgi:hypothetical protein
MPLPTVSVQETLVPTFSLSADSDLFLSVKPDGLIVGYTNPFQFTVGIGLDFSITTLDTVSNSGGVATTIAGSPSPSAFDGSVTTTSDGLLTAYSWAQQQPSGDYDIIAKVHGDPGSILLGGPGQFVANDGDQSGDQIDSKIVAFGNDSFVVSWLDVSTGRLWYSRFDANLSLGFPLVGFLSTSSLGASEYDATTLTGGNVVFTYQTATGDDKFVIFDQNDFGPGLPSPEFDVDGLNVGNGVVSVAALPGGGFVTTYVRTSDDHIEGRVFDATGNATTGVFDVMSNVGGAITSPKVTALSDGRFMVVAQQNGNIVARMMRLDGSPDSEEFQVNSPTFSSDTGPQIATLADGRVAVAWQDTNGSTISIKYEILDPRLDHVELAGLSSSDNNLVGTIFDDTIFGGAKSDILVGDAGNDHLNGGLGNDTLDGGTGNDLLSPGGGADTIDGGPGVDKVLLGTSSAGATITHNADGSTSITYANGSLTLSNVELVNFIDKTVQVRAATPDDFATNNVSDILYRDNATGDTGFYALVHGTNAGWRSLGVSSTAYSIVGTGDFNGDGSSDILYRNNASGGDTGFYAIVNGINIGWHDIGVSSTAYSVVGVGDFNGDTNSDILYRNNASGGDAGFYAIVNGVNNGWHDFGESSTAYSVVGVGDFNGDGTSDILYRNSTNGDTGFYAIMNDSNTGWHEIGASSTAYEVVGVGDFNGDGTSDILFRNNANGDTGFYAIMNGSNTGWHDIGASSTAYSVVATGDYSGDGTTDVLFRNNSIGDTGFYAIVNGVNVGWHDIGLSSTAYHVIG